MPTEEAEIVATCRLAYPEMISALHRHYRSGDLWKEGLRAGRHGLRRRMAAFRGDRFRRETEPNSRSGETDRNAFSAAEQEPNSFTG